MTNAQNNRRIELLQKKYGVNLETIELTGLTDAEALELADLNRLLDEEIGLSMKAQIDHLREWIRRTSETTDSPTLAAELRSILNEKAP